MELLNALMELGSWRAVDDWLRKPPSRTFCNRFQLDYLHEVTLCEIFGARGERERRGQCPQLMRARWRGATKVSDAD